MTTTAAEQFCPACGSRRAEGQRFCGACGRPFAEGLVTVGEGVKPKSGKKPIGRWLLELLLLVAVLAALYVAGFVVTTGSPPGPPAAAADVPPAGTIWFGSAFDPATFVVSGRTSTVGANAPFSFVAHLPRSMDAKDLGVRISFGGKLVSTTAMNATGSGDLWGFSPGPLFAPGVWTYALTDIGGNELASGSITAE